MAVSDAFFVGVATENLTSAATSEMSSDKQSKSSAFLTVQSFTNFAAASGAITTAWLALQVLDADRFESAYWPFLLSIAWLVVSLVTSLEATDSWRKPSFWVSSVFLGLMNSLTLFAAVMGISTVTPGT